MAQAAFVSGLVDQFTSSLVERIFQEVLLVTTFGQDFQFLCDELITIKGLLDTTKELPEDRISSPLSNWLRNVEDILTDAEHIVEECAAASNFKLRFPIFKWSMGHRIKELKDRINNIMWRHKHFEAFGIMLTVNDRFQTSNNSEDNETSSSTDPEIFTVGMEKEIETITNLILQKDTPRSIAIVGMGGSGKTLLLQKVFNSQRVREAGFDHRVWLPISQKFEYKSLLLRIIKEIKPSMIKHVEDLNKDDLKEKIKSLLGIKRCLFAIDDVWDKFVLEKIGLNLQSQYKIVITTRHKNLAESYDKQHEMSPLSSENSWKLFSFHAFPEGHTPPSELTMVAHKIEEKCCGVPLALKTVGCYMAKSVKGIPKEWQSTLDHLQTNALKDIMPCLRLSYQALPYHLKPCFLYFSAFPKNTVIETEYLVYAWISEGFVARSEDAHSVGHSYIKELIDRCLIEVSESSGDGQAKFCKMHDFMHDLADSLHQPTFVFKPGKQLDKFPVEDCLRAYRISLINSSIDNIKKVVLCPRIRTLLISDNGQLESISSRFFNNMRYLSVLDLKSTSIHSLPPSIGKLKLLKLLNLSSTMIKKLPDSLSNLSRLLFLDVSNCKNLKMLHPGIGKHKSMLHLNVEGSKKLKWLPVGISKLVSLQTLKGVEFRSENAANTNALKLKDLKGLTLLKQLSLNVDPQESTANSLEEDWAEIWGGMTKMRNLSIRNSNFEILLKLPEDMNVMDSLEILRLYKCVVPGWMFELQNLMELELHGQCKKEDYKGLQNLHNLRKLHLSHFTDLSDLFPEEFGQAAAFPKLVELILEWSDLREFPLLKTDAMPKLKRLLLKDCTNIGDGRRWQSLKSRKVTITSSKGEETEEISIEGLDSNGEVTGTGHIYNELQNRIREQGSDSNEEMTGTNDDYNEVWIS